VNSTIVTGAESGPMVAAPTSPTVIVSAACAIADPPSMIAFIAVTATARLSTRAASLATVASVDELLHAVSSAPKNKAEAP